MSALNGGMIDQTATSRPDGRDCRREAEIDPAGRRVAS